MDILNLGLMAFAILMGVFCAFLSAFAIFLLLCAIQEFIKNCSYKIERINISRSKRWHFYKIEDGFDFNNNFVTLIYRYVNSNGREELTVNLPLEKKYLTKLDTNVH